MYTEATHIIKNEALAKRLLGYVPMKKAIKEARMMGIIGKFEIHRILHDENCEYIISIKFINEDDRIVSVIYP
jgi:hypothetical protein